MNVQSPKCYGVLSRTNKAKTKLNLSYARRTEYSNTYNAKQTKEQKRQTQDNEMHAYD